MIRNFGWALAAAVSLAGIGAASAADMAVKARPLPPPVYSWTGCYIGLSAGGKGIRTRDTVNQPVVVAPAIAASSVFLGELEDATWIAGGQIGCNYQSGNWVFGIEGDAHGQRWGVSSTLVGQVFPPGFAFGDTFELHSDWQASARGRVGYAMDRTLFYVTGGAAFTEVRAFSSWAAIPGIRAAVLATDDRTLTGWTVGGGVEYAATNNITLGLEGRYSDYGTQRFNSGPVVTAVGAVAPLLVTRNTYRDVRIETGEVMAKVNWKFGPTPVVAKY
jgi:outer membrane immunogenic protein